MGVGRIHDFFEVVDRFHKEVHEGEYFIAGHRYSVIGSGGGTSYALIQTPHSETVHMQDHSVSSEEGHLTVDFYESPSISSTGDVPDSIADTNRQSGNEPSTVVTVNPTVDATGELIQPSLVPGGRGTGGKSDLPQVEMVLAKDETYLMEITNPGTADVDQGTLFIGWYEH